MMQAEKETMEKAMSAAESTAPVRMSLTPRGDRGNMLLADEPANFDNANIALPNVQAVREYTSPNGCHMKTFFRKEHNPGMPL